MGGQKHKGLQTIFLRIKRNINMLLIIFEGLFNHRSHKVVIIFGMRGRVDRCISGFGFVGWLFRLRYPLTHESLARLIKVLPTIISLLKDIANARMWL